MNKIRALIVDDEPLAQRGIRALLKLEHDIEIIAECSNGLEAIAAIEAEAPDLVFLDVQMPDLDGFGVLEAIDPNRIPAIIFVTAYDRYAVRAFDVHALDYLLKPVDPDRFAAALRRARSQLGNRNPDGLNKRLQNFLDDLQAKRKFTERLVIKSPGRIFFLQVDEIDWIEAADNYVRLHTGRESHLLRETMNNVEKRLDPDQFLRVHRSRIVNIQKVKELRPLFHGEYDIMLQDGTRVETGRGYRNRVQRLLDQSSP
jgi:two-component system LytT family response regulator